MINPWILLFAAGLLEVVWATAMRLSDGFSKPLPSIIAGITAFASFWLLAQAMRSLPLGSAYAVWVGVGAVGTSVLGLIYFGESATILRLSGIALILGGIVALKLA